MHLRQQMHSMQFSHQNFVCRLHMRKLGGYLGFVDEEVGCDEACSKHHHEQHGDEDSKLPRECIVPSEQLFLPFEEVLDARVVDHRKFVDERQLLAHGMRVSAFQMHLFDRTVDCQLSTSVDRHRFEALEFVVVEVGAALHHQVVEEALIPGSIR